MAVQRWNLRASDRCSTTLGSSAGASDRALARPRRGRAGADAWTVRRDVSTLRASGVVELTP